MQKFIKDLHQISIISVCLIAAISFFILIFRFSAPNFWVPLQELISPAIYFVILFVCAVFFLHHARPCVLQRIGIELCSLFVFLIGGLALFSQISDTQLGKVFHFDFVHFPTALNIFLIGIALILQLVPQLLYFAQSIMIIVFANAFSILILFLYSYFNNYVDVFFFNLFVASISWLLLIPAFIILHPFKALGGLFFDQDIGGKIFRRLLIFVLIIPTLIGWLVLEGNRVFNLRSFQQVEVVVFSSLLFLGIATFFLSHWILKADIERVRGKKLLNTFTMILKEIQKETVVIHWPLSKHLLGVISETFEADLSELWIFNQEEGLLHCQMVWPDHLRSYLTDISQFKLQPGIGVPGYVYQKKEPISILDAREEPFYIRTKEAEKYGVVQVIGFPLTSIDNDVLGVIVLNKLSEQKFPPGTQNLTSTVGLLAGHFLSVQKTQTALAELASIVNSTDIAVFRKDLNGIILSWNRGAEETYGYKREEVVGKHILMFFPDEKKQEYQWIMKKIMEGEPIKQYETKRKKKNGELFEVSLTISPIFDNQKKVVGASVVVQDITEMKKNAQKLLEQQNELRAKTQELEQFTSLVSHDLQEPARKIIQFGRLILEKKEELDPEIASYVERMAQGSEKLKNFIDSLLELTRASNKLLEIKTIDLNEIVASVVDSVEVKIQETQGKVTFENLPKIEGDPNQIFQLFLNLILNALKFHKTNIPPLIVIQGSQKNHMSRITIQDNGIGIPSHLKSKLFTPFFRAHRKEFEGTGIGLAICQKIVERHHGTIEIESNEQLGTLVIINLPLVNRSQENS